MFFIFWILKSFWTQENFHQLTFAQRCETLSRYSIQFHRNNELPSHVVKSPRAIAGQSTLLILEGTQKTNFRDGKGTLCMSKSPYTAAPSF